MDVQCPSCSDNGEGKKVMVNAFRHLNCWPVIRLFCNQFRRVTKPRRNSGPSRGPAGTRSRTGRLSMPPNLSGPRRPLRTASDCLGRPPTASGSFDPETGAVRYSCRLHCGASLASAKGRRKHEKKHCPNFGKVAPPILKGQRSQLLRQQLAAGKGQEAANGVDPLGAHSLSGAWSSGQPLVTRERRVYECRYCGKVLKTYEGRRLHEKLQHVAKQHQQLSQMTEKLSEAEERCHTQAS